MGIKGCLLKILFVWILIPIWKELKRTNFLIDTLWSPNLKSTQGHQATRNQLIWPQKWPPSLGHCSPPVRVSVGPGARTVMLQRPVVGGCFWGQINMILVPLYASIDLRYGDQRVSIKNFVCLNSYSNMKRIETNKFFNWHPLMRLSAKRATTAKFAGLQMDENHSTLRCTFDHTVPTKCQKPTILIDATKLVAKCFRHVKI